MRAMMAAEGVADFYCRDLSNVKWLTGCEDVFDDEPAHRACVTPMVIFLLVFGSGMLIAQTLV